MTDTERKGLDVSCSELEILNPLRDVDVEDRDEETSIKKVDMDDKQSFLTELRHNTDTQFKVILSICVALANSMLGWIKGQIGPAFLDILYISNTDLERGSAFMTSYYTGRAVGSILGGSLYSRMNRYLILVVSMSINGVTLALIPWCAQYELMVTAHVIQGLCNGVMNF
ncbi:uncharacterized protein LOC110465139 isoform X3 [Mizuhopecten yessoensis]|uniref:uncharacterized protein LOC110465139 isoform X3 n=1 Tax=Mizuhopecten yessoensis TaxID=6573 RepID=UPI000B45C827|nr:uncharacterized protein LOC110465139 isoform X3 [Mizuhopecten yessoensis]